MNKRTIVCFTLMTLWMFFSSSALAADAGLLVSPTRVVLENGKRFVAVTVRNNGDATGRYKIGMLDAVMQENGGIKVLEDGKKDEFSAQDLISLSPSNMTLKPDEYQTVRLLVKNKSDLPDGEYRSHLEVKMTDSDLNPTAFNPLDKGTGISVKTKVTTIIPVIIRKGQTTYTVTVEDAKIAMGGGDNKQEPEVNVSMSFSGNRSVMGDIKITHVAADGKETQVGFLKSVVIYRGVAKRTQAVPLTVPKEINIHSGRLRVAFLSMKDEGSRVLSEKVVTP